MSRLDEEKQKAAERHGVDVSEIEVFEYTREDIEFVFDIEPGNDVAFVLMSKVAANTWEDLIQEIVIPDYVRFNNRGVTLRNFALIWLASQATLIRSGAVNARAR